MKKTMEVHLTKRKELRKILDYEKKIKKGFIKNRLTVPSIKGEIAKIFAKTKDLKWLLLNKNYNHLQRLIVNHTILKLKLDI